VTCPAGERQTWLSGRIGFRHLQARGSAHFTPESAPWRSTSSNGVTEGGSTISFRWIIAITSAFLNDRVEITSYLECTAVGAGKGFVRFLSGDKRRAELAEEGSRPARNRT
jgi:hypothetical protein